MSFFSTRFACGAVATAAALSLVGSARAQDATSMSGTLTPSDGLTLVATQINATTSPNADGGGPSGPGNEVTASSTGNFTQLSNAYASITGTGASATLNLFIGGSVAQNADTKIEIALQTNSSGVSTLAGQTINGEASGGNLGDVSFDTGFKPNAFISLNLNVDQNGGTGTGTSNLGNSVQFTDLSGKNATAPAVTGTLNNALVNTPIGTGAAGDPGFAGASTGLGLSIPLSTLGYTDGTSIEALVFPSVGSDNRTDNQILAPFTYNTADSSGGYDYTYFDTQENGVAGSGRQFTGPDYIGDQYFTIVPSPEPTSLTLLALSGLPMLRRRARKH